MPEVPKPGGGDLGKASKDRSNYSDAPIDATQTGCSGKKPITKVTLLSLAFLSGHGVLKDHDADWSDGGKLYVKPEWDKERQSPVTHTGGQRMQLQLLLDVEPTNAAGPLEITGRAAGLAIRFLDRREVKGGRSHIEIWSDEKTEGLPAEVQSLDMKIHWLLAWTGGDNLVATQNTVFVTLGKPTAPEDCPGFTLKRMREAVRAVGLTKTTNPHSIVDKLMGRFPEYNLNNALDNAWELTDFPNIGADCQTIVRYVNQVIQMVGCPGTATFVVVWATANAPTKAVVTRNSRIPNMMQPTKQWREPASMTEWATLVDLGGARNKYQACLEFSHAGQTFLYAGGVGRMNNADEVLHNFFAMCWANEKDITFIKHRYRRASSTDEVLKKLPEYLHRLAKE